MNDGVMRLTWTAATGVTHAVGEFQFVRELMMCRYVGWLNDASINLNDCRVLKGCSAVRPEQCVDCMACLACRDEWI